MGNESKQQWLKRQKDNYDKSPQETVEDLFIRLVGSCEQYIQANQQGKAVKGVFKSAVTCSRLAIEELDINGL